MVPREVTITVKTLCFVNGHFFGFGIAAFEASLPRRTGNYSVKCAHSEVHLLTVHYQWRREAYCGLSRALDHKSSIEAFNDDPISQLSPGLNGLAVTGDLDTDHQSQTSNLHDRCVLDLKLAQTIHHVSAHLGGVLHHALLEYLEGLQRGCDCDRIPAERRRVRKTREARCLDGRVSVVVGTHTHVQTADEQILAGGTGYITDLGMTGPYDSVIGVESQLVITRFV
jgi:hypothetical protein